MSDLANWLDLPLIWGAILAVGIFMYVLLDGFDLGVGILFPFAPSDQCRDRMMNSVAPFWDGNETWLVLGGGGLFAAFPLAYSIVLPALYLPFILMLIGLIFRGVAFEFRFKAGTKRWVWDAAFHFGSMLATFMQGVILGNFVQGFTVIDSQYAGGPLDWANGFAVFSGVGLIFAYGLLGAGWTIMKTEDITQKWARIAGQYCLIFVVLFMALISIIMPLMDERIAKLWFTFPNFWYLLPIPLISLFAIVQIIRHLQNKGSHSQVFMYAMLLFVTGYAGLAIGIFPWIVPFELTLWQAAASNSSLMLLLVGTVIFLPIILAYTAFSFFTFRGKSSHEHMY